jgi:hypothetical protein
LRYRSRLEFWVPHLQGLLPKYPSQNLK